MGRKILCKLCGTIIQSKYRHDFVSCTCGKVSVDGGDAYLRLIGKTSNMQIQNEKGEWVDFPEDKEIKLPEVF